LDRTIPHHARRVLCIAHRGASAVAPENSAEAIQKAAELGADLVEVDLRSTADDAPVIAHDDSLKRVYGVDGLISELSLAELQARAPVMTFADLVAQCLALQLGIYLDIKTLSVAAAQRLFATVDAHRFGAFVVFASFRPDVIAEIKAARPDFETSILYGSTHIDPVALARATRADYVHPCWESHSDQPHTLMTEAWLDAARSTGLGIITWHEERPPVIAGLKRLGVTGICTDMPNLV
ncbi:MAG: glycerophosphodiester phosphodiesterase, partial [Chloroflexi bacterium]|nr:glycerophosphodiester phosphodiesterase [Chloroflexota bacterium]